jgi:hypothetical protein
VSSQPLLMKPSVFILSTARGQTLIVFPPYESHVDYEHLSITGFTFMNLIFALRACTPLSSLFYGPAPFTLSVYFHTSHIYRPSTWDQWIASDLDCGDDGTNACRHDDKDGEGDDVM